MPQSIQKLNDILTSNGLIPVRYLRYHKILRFIEVNCLSNAETFLIEIPVDFEIKIEINNQDVFKISKIDLDDKNLDDQDNEDLIIEDPLPSNIPDKLDKMYRQSIKISDFKDQDLVKISKMMKQLKRLGRTMRETSFRLSLNTNNFLCVLDEDYQPIGYLIHDFKTKIKRRLMALGDLQIVYDSISRIPEITRHIHFSIYQILSKNQHQQTRDIIKLLTSENDILHKSEIISNKKVGYLEIIEKYESLLSEILEKEQLKISEIDILRGSMSTDTNEISRKHHFESELAKIRKVKHETLENLDRLKGRYHSISLKADEILFDNTKMLDEIVSNFENLSNL